MKLILLLMSLSISILTIGQTVSIDGSSIGFIVMGSNNYTGTAFVINTKRLVFTCAHVIDTSRDIYYASRELTTNHISKHKLKIKVLLPEFDLVLLESDSDLCNQPFVAEGSFAFYANQHVFYLGYDVLKSSLNSKVLTANQTNITSIGKTFEGNVAIDFIEFTGVGLPGYSGGPIINDSGKVVAIMREAWLKKGIKSDSAQLINRAFSIKPLFEVLNPE